MKKLALILIGLILQANVALCADNAGAFLERGFGARPHALGGAFTAVADDANAVYYNSAGLSQINSLQINSMSTKLYDEVEQSYLGAVVPVGENAALGFSYLNTGVSGIVGASRVNIGGQWRNQSTGDTFGYGAQALMVGYGQTVMPKLSLGVTAKFLNEKLDSNKASGFGADVSALYNVNDSLKVGLNIQNIIKPSMEWDTAAKTKEGIPMQMVLGVAGKVGEFTLLGDIAHRQDRDLKYGLGVEYTYEDLVDLRAGYNNGGITAGAGMEYSGVKFNYAFVGSSDGVLENNHTFSVGFDFGVEEKPKAKKQHSVDVAIVDATVIKPRANSVTFTDVKKHWGRKAVESVAGLGIVSGRPNGDFDPSGLLKKVEATKLVLSAYKLKKHAGMAKAVVNLNNVESDKVSVDSAIVNELGAKVKTIPNVTSEEENIQTVVWDGTDSENKVVEDGVYTLKVAVKANGNVVSKEKELHVTTKYINIKLREKGETDFEDVIATHWASGIISEASELGLVVGESDMIFRPNKTFTRIEMILAVARALQMEGHKPARDVEIPYKDGHLISPKYHELVKTYITILGAGGDQFGNLNPHNNLTRAEATIILQRYLNTNKVLAQRTGISKRKIKVVREVKEVKEETIGSVELSVSKTTTGKLVFKGVANDIKLLKVAGSPLVIRTGAGNKFYTKLNAKGNEVVAVEILDKLNNKIEMTMNILDGKVILRGSADKDMKLAVNDKSIYVKSNGKFYSKIFTSSSELISMKVNAKKSLKVASVK